MKKLFALLLVFAMIFATLPFTAFASEATSMQSQLTIKACNAFPEYANKIRAQEQQASKEKLSITSNQSKDVVINETRNISDKESITYTEFSDGLIMLTTSSVSYSTTTTHVISSGSRTYYTMDILAELVGFSGCHATLHNVKYIIDTNGYDKINSFGYSTRGSKCTGCDVGIYPAAESASGPAKLTATIHFLFGNASEGDVCRTELVMTVGSNSMRISYQNLDG